MVKIAIIGAGSVVFSRRLIADVLSWPELSDSAIALVDIDSGRLALVEAMARRLVADGGHGATVEATTERGQALDGADYVIATFATGWSYEPTRPELAIPQRYGIHQTVADTLGVGGVFRFLRTAPVMLDLCRDIERRCPNALLLNYVNPMAMLCWMIAAVTSVRAIGLCHSVQNTHHELAEYLEAPPAEIDYWTAGINHQAWYLRLRRDDEDLYPLLRERMAVPAIYERDRVRFEVLRHFGYFVTESSKHMSEYVPYFLRTPELHRRFINPPAESADERRAQRLQELRAQVAGPAPMVFPRSDEYCSHIIHAIETNQPFRGNFNVPNTGLISNLPAGCCVEVPCLVDSLGIHPCHVGDLPSQLAALNRTNINVQELAVKAALEQDPTAAYHAVQVDPLTAAVVPLDQMRAMVDEIIVAGGAGTAFERPAATATAR
ncbi:MAG: alpha-glucosidase/alpha-galactosidase [Chloroflexi bacterium]|nr:alpha-glucosidase/alpha-galactosidase [Chloroflexota bacterium]